MLSSQQAAEAVGLRALGEDVQVRPTGVVVAAIAPGSPAETAGIQLGDVILSVDGAPTRTVEALRSRLEAAGIGHAVELGVHRDGGMLRIAATTAKSPRDGKAMIGIVAEQAQTVSSDRKVTFDIHGVGGPSAGLAFALQIYSAGKGYADLGGKRVAATGTIDLDGQVGPIGGVAEKAVGARRAGADLLLVPGPNAAEARAAHVPGLRIVAVRTFDEALGAIRSSAGS
jgi:PDZ domain-containing protein